MASPSLGSRHQLKTPSAGEHRAKEKACMWMITPITHLPTNEFLDVVVLFILIGIAVGFGEDHEAI